MRERREEIQRLQQFGPRPIVHDPTDGDELADREAREAKERARAEGKEGDPAGGIAR